MSPRLISCLGFLCLLPFLTLLQLPHTQAEYPGVIELVGFNNRRARTHYSGQPTLAPSPAKLQLDIETVKRNIEKYNRLLTLDTRHLPESQKDMLERIVERVARLKETLDLEERNNAAAAAATATAESDAGTTPLTESPTEAETETDPTLVLDETTLLHLQSSMDELAAAQKAQTLQELPTTTEYSSGEQQTNMQPEGEEVEDTQQTAATMAGPTAKLDDDGAELIAATTNAAIMTEQEQDETEFATDTTDANSEQFVAARSNNNNHISAITAADALDGSTLTTTSLGSQQRTLTTSKLTSKTRATKRPNGSKVTTPVRSGTSTKHRGQRPSSAAAAGASTAGIKANKHKLASTSAAQPQSSTTTTLPLQYSQKQPSNGQKHHKTPQHSSTSTTTTTAAVAAQQAAAQQATADKNYEANPAAAAAAASSSAAAAAVAADLYQRQPAAASSSSGTMPNGYSSIGSPNYNSAANKLAMQSLNANDPISAYDAHVNASAIIDSLNNNAREEYYQQKQPPMQSQQQSLNVKDQKPATATAKPTKYHYYPHNQHIYLLPECAIQQVCNAVYVRLNYTQPLCACPSRYRDPCSASLNEDDQHTTKLVGDGKKKAITLAKTCEATTEMRECRSPKDWSLLALQNTRTGKSHYLVICRCPTHFKLEGPMAHDQPTYASVPGIRVFGMMCVKPGHSVRKPSAQPPKRYQLQKPYYRPSSSSIGGGSQSQQSSYLNVGNNNPYTSTKDSSSSSQYGSRPGASSLSSNYHNQQDSIYQSQHQANYQYLNRPESHSSQQQQHGYRPVESLSLNSFQNGIYGRNNERKGDAPIEAVAATGDNVDGEQAKLSTSTQASSQELSNEALQQQTTLTDLTEAEPKLAPELNEQILSQEAAEAAAQQLTMNHEEEHEAAVVREKRSLIFEDLAEFEDDTPEFPWDRVLEFHRSIVWD